MALASSLTTLAGTAPVSTTWTLMSRDSQSAVYQDRRRGVSALSGIIKMTIAQIKDERQRMTGKYRVGFAYSEPVVRTVSGVDVSVGAISFRVEARVAAEATDAEKAHALKVAQSMLAHAIVGTSLTTGEALT